MLEDGGRPWRLSAGDLHRIVRSTGLRAPGHIKTLWTQRGRHDVALADAEAHGFLFLKIAEHHSQTVACLRSSTRSTSCRRYIADGVTAFKMPCLICVVSHPTAKCSSHEVIRTTCSLLVTFHGERTARRCFPDPAPLAEAVAAIHRLPILSCPALPPREAPVSTQGRVGPSDLNALPEAFAELLRVYQQRDMDSDLRHLRATWSHDSVIHGDLTVSNILCHSDVGPHRYILTDWELSGIGDPLWDIGSLVGSLAWASLSFERPLAGSWISTFLRDYANATSRDVDFQRIFRWAGNWILQRTLALPPPRTGLSQLQLRGLNIVEELLT